MPSKSPTNASIIVAIGAVSRDIGEMRAETRLQHKETSARLDAVEAQVKYTNGQVRDLKTWQAVMQDRDKRGAQSGSNPKVAIDSLLLKALGLLGTALAIIGVLAGLK